MDENHKVLQSCLEQWPFLVYDWDLDTNQETVYVILRHNPKLMKCNKTNMAERRFQLPLKGALG